MSSRWRKWCPDGCGKSVVGERKPRAEGYEYKCFRCKKAFTKEEIK